MYIIRRTFEVWGITAAICLCVAWCQVGAAGLDGSTPIICAFTSAAGCDSGSGCESTTPEALGLPRFFRVDFTNKRIIAAGPVQEGTKTETKIQNFQRLDGQLVFQGVEVRGWSMVVTENTGRMTLTASGDDEAFVLFGACISQ
jgi:hypothetical protein